MLCLNLTSGEYLTIGENVVVQLDRVSGDSCKLMIQAPREIPIVRGEVRERNGKERPGCVFDGPRWHRNEISWNRSKAQALNACGRCWPRWTGATAACRLCGGSLITCSRRNRAVQPRFQTVDEPVEIYPR